MKVLNWIVALLGLWEFGDIAAIFVPDFGKIQAFVWDHIIVGLILMIAGVWAAQTGNVGTAKKLNWIAAIAGIWLVVSSFILGNPFISVGLWNDIVVGVIVLILSIWVTFKTPREIG
ncbi:MAG: hypothetical protein WAM60_03010 [Candidatus Promineifilaceae bacterium]